MNFEALVTFGYLNIHSRPSCWNSEDDFFPRLKLADFKNRNECIWELVLIMVKEARWFVRLTLMKLTPGCGDVAKIGTSKKSKYQIKSNLPKFLMNNISFRTKTNYFYFQRIKFATGLLELNVWGQSAVTKAKLSYFTIWRGSHFNQEILDVYRGHSNTGALRYSRDTQVMFLEKCLIFKTKSANNWRKNQDQWDL